VEASALSAPAAVARARPSIGTPLLRLRSDEQLVALFRAGHDDAFRVIHDRYRQRLFAYTRQMLPHRQDAEDALQDVFVRAYAGLRANDRELALRAWLYRVAHNRCIDELRRPSPPPPEVIELLRSPVNDPIAEADQRESLRRLIADVRRLPGQQRSALLMRELGGMSYADMAAALGVTIPAVKSLLVRARLALARALEARDTACSEIREALILCHDRGLRPTATARRHMRDCAGCREFRHELRGVSRRFAAIVPTLGPIGVIANLLGAGGAGSGAAGGAVAVGGVAGTGSAVVGAGALSGGATHVVTLLAAAMVTAGGAVELQHTLPATTHHHHHARAAAVAPARSPAVQAAPLQPSTASPPAPSTPEVTASTPPQAGSAGSALADNTSVALTANPTPSTTITVTTATTGKAKVKQRSTGGVSTVISVGGVSPSAPADSAATPADSTSSSTSAAGTSSTGSTDSTGSGQPVSGSGSSTQTGATTSTQPAPSDTSAGASPSTGTGTGSPTSTPTGTPPAPSQ
jgi:RNA polymerase sigma factor (sigma-70 family)